MIRKFDAKNFKWDGIETLVYKQDGSPFKDVTRQVLYDGAYDIPCQFRYFECLPGGYSLAPNDQGFQGQASPPWVSRDLRRGRQA